MGFWSVRRWTISKECLMMRTAIIFLPLFRPCCISESVTLYSPDVPQLLLEEVKVVLKPAVPKLVIWQQC